MNNRSKTITETIADQLQGEKRIERIVRLAALPSIIIALSAFLASCQAIADIFKAGVFIGIVVVIVILGLIALLMNMFKK